MKKLLNYLLALAVILLISGCKRKATRPYPTKVIYREVVNDNDSKIVWRESYYTLDSVKYDTIYRKNTNNVVPPTNEHRFSIPDDKVDLNDYSMTQMEKRISIIQNLVQRNGVNLVS